MIIVILTPNEVLNKLNELKLYSKMADQVTPTFASVRNYCNNQGEVSNYVVNFGASYENAKKADIAFLSNPDCIKDMEFGKHAPLAESARLILLNAMQTESNQSKAQQDTYTTVFPNVRVHNETGRVYIFGFRISKQVLVPGVYKTVNSQALTIAKDVIRKSLRTNDFRQYCVDKLVEIKMKGETLEFDC